MRLVFLLAAGIMVIFSMVGQMRAAESSDALEERLGERDKLVTAFSEATRRVQRLERELAEVLEHETKKGELEEKLADAARANPPDPVEQTRLKLELSSLVEEIGMRSSAVVSKELAAARTEIASQETKLKAGVSGIAELDSEQRFRKSISYVFAGLIAIVIVGFFITTHSDKDVRMQVFSADNGIQFVTLFSLVIAIILFGIMKVLEGKELSALLGGLSGYILGRSRGSSNRPSEPSGSSGTNSP